MLFASISISFFLFLNDFHNRIIGCALDNPTAADIMVHANFRPVARANIDNGIIEYINDHKGIVFCNDIQFGIVLGVYLAHVEPGYFDTPTSCPKTHAFGLIFDFYIIIKENPVLLHSAFEMRPNEVIVWVIMGKAKINAFQVHLCHRAHIAIRQ